jgi:hypothetical protein
MTPVTRRACRCSAENNRPRTPIHAARNMLWPLCAVERQMLPFS